MAFVNQQNQQNANVAAPGQIPQQAPVSAGGAGVGGSSKAPVTPGQNVPAQPSAQLSAYLNANQPQAEQFGQKIAGDLSNQTQAAGAAITPAVNAYTGNIYSVPTNAQLNQKVATAPSTLTAEEKAAYQKELGAASKSPSPTATFETTKPYQDLTGGIQKVVEQANLWNAGNNVGSLTTALQPFETEQATSGDKILDAILLSRTPNAYGQIQQAVAPAYGYQGQLDAGTAQANKALIDAINTNAATSQAATGSAQNYASNLSDYLANIVSQTQNRINSQIAANGPIYTDYVSGTLTPADAVALGIPQDKADSFAAAFNNLNPAINSLNSLAYGGARAIGYSANDPTGLHPFDFSPFMKQAGPVPEINKSNVASQQNYSDIAALQEMLGTNGNVNLPINSLTADQAGKGLGYNAYNTFDASGIKTQLDPMRQSANKFLQYLTSTSSSNPPQNAAQASVITSGFNGINDIISYLNQLSGLSANAPAPAPTYTTAPLTPPGVPTYQQPPVTNPTEPGKVYRPL